MESANVLQHGFTELDIYQLFSADFSGQEALVYPTGHKTGAEYTYHCPC